MRRLLAATAVSALMIGSAMAQVSGGVGGAIDGNAGVSTDSNGVTIGGTGSGSASGTVNDNTVTGSTSGSASASAGGDFMDGLGDDAAQFFGDDDQLRSDDEITTNFNALSQDRRDEIKDRCGDLDEGQNSGQAVIDFCTKVGNL